MIVNKIKEKIKIKPCSKTPLEDYFYNSNRKYIDKCCFKSLKPVQSENK
jgi:hypothetical protein